LKLRFFIRFVLARNEITRGIQEIHKGVQEGAITEQDICEDLISESFQLLPTAPLGLLVRTSGETRLSDFLLWQSTKTVLCFANVLWPDFTYWHLLSAVLHYQINQISMKLVRSKVGSLTAYIMVEFLSKNVFTFIFILDCFQLYLPETDDAPSKESNERREKFIEMFRERKWRRLEEDASRLSSST